MNDFKSILSDALNEIKDEELNNIPSENEIEYEFSDDFKRKANMLIKKQNKKFSSKTFRKSIIILVAAILTMLIAGSAVAENNKVLDFFYKIRNDNILFIFEKDEKNNESFKECFYTLNYIPEEYSQTKFSKDPYVYHAITVWKSSNNKNSIILNQKINIGTVEINTYGNYVEEIRINSQNVLYIDKKENISCFWKEKGYFFHLSYPKELGKDFIMKNAGNLIDIS